MLQLDDLSYSENDTVAAIGDYFSFLTRMYLDEATVEWPPEGGWPEITASALEGLEKSERVVSLLRHLPYIQDLGSNQVDRPQGAPEAHFSTWKDFAAGDKESYPRRAHGRRILTEGRVCDISMPDVVGLWEGGRDSPLILLDTNYGIVYWLEFCDDVIRYQTRQEQVEDDYEVWATKEEANWRCDAPAWTVPDFFTMLREQFEQLHFLPINSRQVITSYSEYSDDGEMEPLLQRIYRGHGWPDLEHYRKGDCIRAVEQVMEEKYPDFFPF